jgi:hypothetical protein
MKILRLLPCLLLLALAVVPAQAQDANATCPTLVSEALASIGSVCSGAVRNSACYGYDRVNATFFQAQPDDLFAKPGDQTELGVIQTIRTAGLDPENGVWGLALLQLQANIPDALPGQSLTFLLMGDVEVQNAVTANEIVIVPVTATTNANLRSGPGTNFNVLGSSAAGQSFNADGLSADGQWVRIDYQGEPAWISLSLVTGDTGTLNVAQEGDTLAPMQAIYLKTGLGAVECEGAPASSLVVQGPQGLTVNFSVNGAQVEIGSTVVFQAGEGSDGAPGAMQIAVLDGHAVADGVYIPTGHTSEVELDEEGLVIEDTWTEPDPFSEEERDLFAPFEELDGLPLAYDIELPTDEEIAEAALLAEEETAVDPDLPFAFGGDYELIMALLAEYGLTEDQIAGLSPEELQARVMALSEDPDFLALMEAFSDESFGDFGDFSEGDPGFPDDGGDGGDGG